jgi:AbrB family looped-hinge helix DNA binding protein
VGKPLTTVISTKGQVILPKAMREALSLRPGMKLVVEKTPEGILLKPAPLFAPSRFEEVFGMLKHEGPAKTVEQMDEGIAAAVTERDRRSRH